MLEKCPECELMVSDKAATCPHCGYPLKLPKISKPRTNRRRRLPNGFGQITELKGRNLRKPFRVMVTVDKDEDGKPICKPLKPEAYFATYNDAYQALLNYNKDPFDVQDETTMVQLYERWHADFFKPTDRESTVRTYESAWAYCTPIYDVPVRTVRGRHIAALLENPSRERKGKVVPATREILKRMKTLLSTMFDYAVRYELTDRNYPRETPIATPFQPTNPENPHKAFTKEEMELIWSQQDDPVGRMVLIQCYTGFRPSELCKLRTENINLEEAYIIGGLKTDAGRNRIVPIHSKIQTLITDFKAIAESQSNEYLFPSPANRSNPMYFQNYEYRFDRLMAKLDISGHRPHDCRKTFITKAKEFNVNDIAIKRIVGHTIRDITESIYTERPVEWLRNEIEKIR